MAEASQGETQSSAFGARLRSLIPQRLADGDLGSLPILATLIFCRFAAPGRLRRLPVSCTHCHVLVLVSEGSWSPSSENQTRRCASRT